MTDFQCCRETSRMTEAQNESNARTLGAVLRSLLIDGMTP